MSEKLTNDVKGAVAFTLCQLRGCLISLATKITPEELVDQTIAGTVEAIEQHFTLTSSVVVDAEGTPVTVDGLVDEYWAMVTDGEDDEPFDLRATFGGADNKSPWNTPREPQKA